MKNLLFIKFSAIFLCLIHSQCKENNNFESETEKGAKVIVVDTLKFHVILPPVIESTCKCQMSQAYTFFYEDNPSLYSFKTGQIKEMLTRGGEGYEGVLYGIYLRTNNPLMNIAIRDNKGNEGFNNCSYDIYHLQGRETKNSGLFYCSEWKEISPGNPDNRYNLFYEIPSGMRFRGSITIVIKNISPWWEGKVIELIVLYATCIDCN